MYVMTFLTVAQDLLATPRCGFEDQFALFEEFNLEGSMFDKKKLTYTVTKYSEKLTRYALYYYFW